MLIIRKSQMKVFQGLADDAFVVRLVGHLRSDYSMLVNGLSVETLIKRVRYGINQGRKHGLTWESSLAGFVILMFQLGPNLAQLESFCDALSAKDLNEVERVYRAMYSVSIVEWSALRYSTDEGKWPDVRR